MTSQETPQTSHPPSRFATTQWSLVLSARQESSPESKQALASLCETYWYPLYTFVRRQGFDAADAQDLTQGFFTRLLEKRDLEDVDPRRGRFRSFLLASIKHFLINEWDRARTAKRGGAEPMLSIDFKSADSRYRPEPADLRTPEANYQRQWALTLLGRVQEALRCEHTQAEKQRHFELLRVYMTGDVGQPAYREIAEQLGTSEGAVKVAVHRLRRRFRELLRNEIAQTVASEDEIDDEIQSLFEALRGQ